MKYNTINDKCNVIALTSMLVQEETMLKNQMTHSVYLISHQEAKKNPKENVEGANTNVYTI